jgi:sensor histidine kinase YesM
VLRVTVSDTGPGLQPGTDPTKLFGVTSGNSTNSTGVGLANIRDRLAQAYGEEQRFEISNHPEGGFSVVIELPFEVRQTVSETAPSSIRPAISAASAG